MEAHETAPFAAARATAGTRAVRIFSWAMTAVTFAFLLNNYLTVWQGWLGA